MAEFCECVASSTCPSCRRPVLRTSAPELHLEERRVLTAALRWWEQCRPLAWTAADHLEAPTVNTATEPEKRLAEMVAKLVKARKGMGGEMVRKIGLALAAALLVSGCALKFEARLIDPWNRPVAMEDERRLVLQARQMLAPCTGDLRLCSMSRDEAAKNLESQGLSAAEAERIVALALAANAAAANKQ